MSPSYLNRLSIVISVYNCDALVKRCIDSLITALNGSLPELVIADNASSSATRELIDAYAALGIAEAMLLGKPVIVTNWSAPCEFCNEENAILIPYKFTPIQTSARPLPYDGVTRWAEPDVDATAKALRRLYDDPALRRQLGESGRKTIREHFATESFKKSVEAFLAG